MSNEPQSLFGEQFVEGEPWHQNPAPHELVRTVDPDTSHAAARANPLGRGTHRHRLLEVYSHSDAGFIDEEVSALAGIESGGWKRCADLRKLGYTVPTGEKKEASSGLKQRICVITESGRDALSRTEG